MSAVIKRLQRAEAILRTHVKHAPTATRTSGVTEGVWIHGAFHLTTTPARETALADLLRDHAADHEDGDCRWVDCMTLRLASLICNEATS